MTATNPAIYAFLKFGAKQHLEELRRDGLLYMSPLASFAKLESDMVRDDRFEGTTRIMQPKHIGEFVIDTGRVGFGKINLNPLELTGPVRIGLHQTASCNVYCLFAVTGPVDGELVDHQNFQFGDSFVLFFNPTEFLNRVVVAAQRAGLRFLEHKLVEYYDGDNYSGETGRFRKRSLFSYQKEFRIIVEPGSDTPTKLLAGCLADITSDVLPMSEVNEVLDFSTRSAREAGIVN